MNTQTALAPAQSGTFSVTSVIDHAAPLATMQRMISLIDDYMKSIMKEGIHYGKIPGTGDKPTLLKAGAEKLCVAFQFSPQFEETVKDVPGMAMHREYSVKCKLFHRPTGALVAEGIGICSTLEKKYRYRPGPKKFTGKIVPKEYWDERKANPGKAQDMLGGKGFTVSKNPALGNRWEICEQGEATENPDPAEQWNTVVKMATKRALVAAVLIGTGASDVMTQDLEDIISDAHAVVDAAAEREEPRDVTPQQSAPRQTTPAAPAQSFDRSNPNWWQGYAIHFGTNKGKALGELNDKQLEWYQQNWGKNAQQAKADKLAGKEGARWSPQDDMMLDAILASMGAAAYAESQDDGFGREPEEEQEDIKW